MWQSGIKVFAVSFNGIPFIKRSSLKNSSTITQKKRCLFLVVPMAKPSFQRDAQLFSFPASASVDCIVQRRESWAFANILSMLLLLSPSPSSYHTETKEQAAGPSCCVGATESAAKDHSAGQVDAVPVLSYCLVGALHCFWLMGGCLAHISWPVGHLICVLGGSSSNLVWFWMILIIPSSLLISLWCV